MVLAGGINKALVAAIASAGGRAVGVSQDSLITAWTIAVAKSSDSAIQKAVDLGFVGEPANIDVTVLNALMMHNLIPVVAPVGSGEDGNVYINADTAAGAISAALNAKRMLMLTDVRGVPTKMAI